MKTSAGERLESLQRKIIAPQESASFWTTLKQVVGFHWKWYCAHAWMLLGGSLLTAGIALLIIRPFESNFNDALRTTLPGEGWSNAAQFLSWSGEYSFLLFVFIGSLLLGRLFKSRRLFLVAHCLLASLLFSTLVTRTGKAAIGRLRPISAIEMQVPDQFIGPTMTPKYHSFPSGHTSASFSGATPLFLSHPILGTPVIAYATCVSLSRAYNRQHYLSDLIAGLWIGFACSLPALHLLRRDSIN